MRLTTRVMSAMFAVAMLTQAAPAHADPDTDFAGQLHGYGIYGPLDYTAWLGKITCERLRSGLDSSADKSVHFALINLPPGSTPIQSWQFVSAAIGTYCPDQMRLLTAKPSPPSEPAALRR